MTISTPLPIAKGHAVLHFCTMEPTTNFRVVKERDAVVGMKQMSICRTGCGRTEWRDVEEEPQSGIESRLPKAI